MVNIKVSSHAILSSIPPAEFTYAINPTMTGLCRITHEKIQFAGLL